MKDTLLSIEVREYLLSHLHTNAAAFLLRSHPFDICSKRLTQQLIGLQKSQFKFPDLFNNTQVLFPPKVNLEQTSSSTTAQYKAGLVSGKTMADLTGGFGIDVSAFAKAGFSSTHIEKNTELQLLSEQLFKAQNLSVVSHAMNGMDYVYDELDKVDLIYMDPGRKTSAVSKAVYLQDYEPNILDHLEVILHKCDFLMVKTSPMLDINLGLTRLKYVSQLHVVAVKNEVKELLWLLKDKADSTSVTCVNLETSQPQLKFNFNTDQVCEDYAAPQKYLYEPNAAIMKSQGFKSLAVSYDLKKLDHNAHLLTGDHLVDFPGRIFKVIKTIPYKPKSIKRDYAKSARGVVTRNFKNTVEQLRNKFQLKEHESDYLFFTSVLGKGATVIEVKKI